MLSVDIFLTLYTKDSSFVELYYCGQEDNRLFCFIDPLITGSTDPNLYGTTQKGLAPIVPVCWIWLQQLFSFFFSLAPEATFHILKWIFICYCLTRVCMLCPQLPCVTMRFPQGYVSLFILVPGDVSVTGTQLYIILKTYKQFKIFF